MPSIFRYIIIILLCAQKLMKPIFGGVHHEAVPGGKVALSCNTSIWSEDAVSLVMWFRGNSSSPIYSVDARSSLLPKAKHFQAEVLKNRATFDTSLSPPVLRIDPVKREDEGEYKCRVDYKRTRTQVYSTFLNITVPPTEALIKDDYGQRLHQVIGPYDEGSSLTLICEVEGGKPSPSVTWWKGSTMIDDSYVITSLGFVKNDIRLSDLQRSDLMAVLSCKASNTNLTEPLDSSVTIDLNLKPLDVRITSHLSYISAGHKVEVDCQAMGSRPPAQISWWKGTDKMTGVKESISNDGNITYSTLEFVASVADNGKYLVCRAENAHLSNSGIEDGRTLNVHYIPQVSLMLGTKLRADSIREGIDVYLECGIVANPRVSEVEWLFKGRRLIHNPREGIISTNQTLVLQKIRRQSSGGYHCTARNSEGIGDSNEFFLKVNFAPVCKPDQKAIYVVTEFERIDVSCEVEAEPLNIRFQWQVNNSQDLVEFDSFTSENGRSVATYVPKPGFNTTVLYCKGENTAGLQSEPCIFYIVPAGPPHPVKNCVVANQSQESLLIECQAGEDGGLRQTFYLEVYDGDRNLQSNLSARLPVFQLEDLTPGSPFLLIIYSANAKGKSRPVSLRVNTLILPQRHTGKDSTEQIAVTPVVGILIGIVGALVLVAIIVVVVVKMKEDNDVKEPEDMTSIDRCPYSIPDTRSTAEIELKEPDVLISGSRSPDITIDSRISKAKHELSQATEGYRSPEHIDPKLNHMSHPQKKATDPTSEKVPFLNQPRTSPVRWNELPTEGSGKEIKKVRPILQRVMEEETVETPLMMSNSPQETQRWRSHRSDEV